jgi:dTDP-4-dehydrorhamnose reductase
MVQKQSTMVDSAEGHQVTMWLIVGANGQLGQSLRDSLLSEGIEFIATSRQDLDITDSKQVNKYFETHKFSTIVNCAAWTAVDDAEDHIPEALRINYEGPKNLATAAIKTQSRLIHISTDYVFSGDATEPYEIDTPTNPLNAYGQTKQEGDSAVFTIGNGGFPIVRTAWLYSRYGNNFAKTMAKRAIQGLPVRVVDDQLGQPTSAIELSRLIIEAAIIPNPPSIIHGTNSGKATWYEFAQEIYNLLGASTELVTPVSSSEFPTRASRPKYSVLGHRAFRENGLTEMQDWKSALKDEIEAIREAVSEELK